MTPAGLIITYARSENVLRLIDKFMANGVKKIYISIDGAKNENIDAIQSKLKMELREKNQILSDQIYIWHRQLNMGSGASVIASLDWVFSREEEVIILEDDLEVGDEFFDFVQFGLKEMKIHKNLKIVTGTNPFEDITKDQFGRVNYPVSWGWATNRENWCALRELIFSFTPGSPSLGQLQKKLYWSIGKKRALLGQIEAWDIPLASEMYKTFFFTLIPSTNLVRNTGFDQHASHTTESTWPLNLPISSRSEKQDYKLEPRQLKNLNKNFETRIFKIKKHHVLSWLLHKTLDRYRFKADLMTLVDRTKLERFPIL